jgi:uncharacterized protein (TIGR03437 family)
MKAFLATTSAWGETRDSLRVSYLTGAPKRTLFRGLCFNQTGIPISGILSGSRDGGAVTAGHPAGRGQTATLYASGLGPVTNTPASGEPAAVSPSSEIPHATPVTVAIGGQPAEVLFAGLTLGLPGLYQINVRVPSGIPAGPQPVTVAVGGKTSKASSIAVR